VASDKSAIASVLELLLLLIQLNGVLGCWIFWGLVNVALIVYAGWQSSTWKKRDWKVSRSKISAIVNGKSVNVNGMSGIVSGGKPESVCPPDFPACGLGVRSGDKNPAREKSGSGSRILFTCRGLSVVRGFSKVSGHLTFLNSFGGLGNGSDPMECWGKVLR